jgi:alpha-galactosidase
VAIIVDDINRVFTLHTKDSTYQMKADAHCFLLHLYYGTRADNTDFSFLLQQHDRGFSGNPADVPNDRSYSADTLPLEYPCSGIGDYRENCLDVVYPNGSNSTDLRYSSYSVQAGKPAIPGMPGVRANCDECTTLNITLRDRISGLQIVLQYCVLESANTITRRAKILNHTGAQVILKRALSCCLDFFQPDNRDMITFYGRHAGEFSMERACVRHGKNCIGSTRGASSLQYNPFMMICNSDTTETSGNCVGFLFVYSGNFIAQAELDQIDQLRTVVGINPQGFRWVLDPGSSFETPEVILCFSSCGLGHLSNDLHSLIRAHLVHGKYQHKRRPILINNWEATYFDFDDKKLIEIAEHAKGLGIELFVLDDGWFGERNDDTSSLGDWYVNTEKIRCGLPALSKKIHSMGMKFGIWIEPEMISMKSKLRLAHPDWLMSIPNRAPISSRCQYVLDMSRSEVIDQLTAALFFVLDSGDVDYVKWDMNRNISDVWSYALDASHQGEVFHRYILGVYDLLERITERYPNLLLETCSGGGGRFDAGMLYYSPQIWCSDNTDPIARLEIQYGASFAYPCSCVGAHVSASPNHQTGRSTPIHTRAVVAMAGTFGYELDPAKLTHAEKDAIRSQVKFYKENWEIFSEGTYYRLTDSPASSNYCAWLHVSPDQSKAIISLVCKTPLANSPVVYVKLRGLDSRSMYLISTLNLTLSGQALMSAGLPVPEMRGDYPALQIILTKI